ncbi:MAG TPA: pyridoxal phosphate-dependent aminotransferase family protein [Planctomycetota bacterium]|nr:pyridoxal phosphate-dependent aminotransferase family protein [Planctomycetota bacterium]
MSRPAGIAEPATESELEPRVAIEASSARTIVVGSIEYVYFGGCNYLALAHEPRVVAALREGAARYGISSGAARETTGNVRDHEELEREIANALDFEDALLLPEGACASLALGESLQGEFPAAIIDHESHPTLVHAARTSATSLAIYTSVDAAVASIRAADGTLAVWTDGVFPSAGRAAPLGALLAALPAGRGLLVVDDCHGFGVLGRRGRGSVEAEGLRDPRLVVIGTLSKALGTYGGFVAGTRAVIARVRRRSAVYAGTTPLPPALAVAARAALAIHVGEPERHAAYAKSVRRFRERMGQLGLSIGSLEFPVFAFELDPPERMRRVHEFALREGLFLPLIRYAGGGAHGFFRIVWNAAHTEADLNRLSDVLRRALESA